MNFLENKSLRDVLLETNSNLMDKAKKIVNGYELKNYTLKQGVVDIINGDDFKKLLSLPDDHKKLFK
ncbi:hypothetical protein FACS1894176_01770 [Bacteroidia bacterium]|nr:hypothetical protein FACS1894176_01770 [Bacteroidia bacterium]